METVTQWESEKLELAARLTVALTAVVGDVAGIVTTGAYLSWCTAAGAQGHWRVEGSTFWLGRIVTDRHGAGTQSTQLVLTLERLGEDQAWLAHPTVYHGRTGEGLLMGYPPDTPQIYTSAHALLTTLAEELRTLLPPLGQTQEETGDDA